MQRVTPAGPDEPEALWRPDRFAAGIAVRLIDNGVRADRGRLGGRRREGQGVRRDALRPPPLGPDLGRSTLAARQEIWDRNSSDNTWGAYQVYGPPAFLLGVRNTGAGDSRRRCRGAS